MPRYDLRSSSSERLLLLARQRVYRQPSLTFYTDFLPSTSCFGITNIWPLDIVPFQQLKVSSDNLFGAKLLPSTATRLSFVRASFSLQSTNLHLTRKFLLTNRLIDRSGYFIRRFQDILSSKPKLRESIVHRGRQSPWADSTP